jgi:hypothetical protein
MQLEPTVASTARDVRRRHLLSADRYRQIRTERFQQWREAMRLPPAA